MSKNLKALYTISFRHFSSPYSVPGRYYEPILHIGGEEVAQTFLFEFQVFSIAHDLFTIPFTSRFSVCRELN